MEATGYRRLTADVGKEKEKASMSDDKQSLESKFDKMIKEPLTAKEKAGAFVVAIVLIALCVGVWMLPDLINHVTK